MVKLTLLPLLASAAVASAQPSAPADPPPARDAPPAGETGTGIELAPGMDPALSPPGLTEPMLSPPGMTEVGIAGVDCDLDPDQAYCYDDYDGSGAHFTGVYRGGFGGYFGVSTGG